MTTKYGASKEPAHNDNHCSFIMCLHINDSNVNQCRVIMLYGHVGSFIKNYISITVYTQTIDLVQEFRI